MAYGTTAKRYQSLAWDREHQHFWPANEWQRHRGGAFGGKFGGEVLIFGNDYPGDGRRKRYQPIGAG